MIKIFTGDDRVAAGKEIKKLLGADYEVIDCADLTPRDLPSIFRGSTIFASSRRILLRDFTANTSIFHELPNFLDTRHDIIMLETKLDKRTTIFKEIKNKVEIKEFKLPPAINFRIVFDIYKTAKKDGKKAVNMLEKIKSKEDPIQFTGLLVSQALKDFEATGGKGIKEKRTLKALSTIDIQMKSTKIDPWLLVESFLLELNV
ncbi:hypothetical protein IJ076_00055 [Candidatus Saccharibacteria bacterium]|nr:hypothetical protein [Candidatus Saccharibacteria bacterium]